MTKQEIKKLDKLARELCLVAQLPQECEACGKTSTLQTHHYIGRRNRALRWVQANLFCLCSGCHTLRRDSFHQDPIWGREQAIRLRGVAWEAKLTALKNCVNKLSYDENLAMLTMDIDEVMVQYGL